MAESGHRHFEHWSSNAHTEKGVILSVDIARPNTEYLDGQPAYQGSCILTARLPAVLPPSTPNKYDYSVVYPGATDVQITLKEKERTSSNEESDGQESRKDVLAMITITVDGLRVESNQEDDEFGILEIALLALKVIDGIFNDDARLKAAIARFPAV